MKKGRKIFWVDMPNPYAQNEEQAGEWVNVNTFFTKKEVLKCLESYGIPKEHANIFISEGRDEV